MARPWISLLLLSLVLVAIDASKKYDKYERCPDKNVCLLWARESCNGFPRGGTFGEGTATGYFWGYFTYCEEGDERDLHTFSTSLWIEPLSARKWQITTRITNSVHKTKKDKQNTFDETDYEFDFGNVKIGLIKIKNETTKEMDLLMQFSWKKAEDGEWSSSTYPTKFISNWHDPQPLEEKTLTYPAYTSVVESAENLITLFGDVTVIKSKGSGNVVDNDVSQFNGRLHDLAICDPSELHSFEFVNAVNGTIPMKKDEKEKVDCPSNLWYRNKTGGGWEPMDLMRCTNGVWQGKYSPKIKVTTTVAPTEEDEGEDDPNAQGLRAARSIDNEESDEKFEYGPEEKYDLTGADVVCGENPPAPEASPSSAGVKIAIGFGIFILLLIIAAVVVGVILALRRKRAAAGPYDTFRAGSESKAQTPKGGSMSKKSGSVAEFGGMSPAGTPNAPK